jgi:ACDE family multidrug resistance protein
VIVGAASGGLAGAIMLYEAALGLGIASGPLLGGLLGGISWRGPFFGTAVLMAIGFVLITALLGPTPRPERKISLGEALRALGHSGLRSMAVVAALYNFGFFTLLAYTPFPLGLGARELGPRWGNGRAVVALALSRRHVTAASPARAARSAVAGATPAPSAGRA